MFKSILFPVNLQETALSDRALKMAIHNARTADAALTVMTVAPGFGMPIVASYFPDDAVQEALKEIARQLEAYIGARIPGDIKTRAVVTEGNPAEQIVRQANEAGADLIIIPSHDQGLEQVLLGSVAARVARHAHCSVLVVKGE